MAKKVADQLVDTLEKAGVRRIYAVTGDRKRGLMPLRRRPS